MSFWTGLWIVLYLLWYNPTTTSYYRVLSHLVTRKELPCVMLCVRVSHVHTNVKHCQLCLHVQTNITYRAKTVAVSQFAWPGVLFNTWNGGHLSIKIELKSPLTCKCQKKIDFATAVYNQWAGSLDWTTGLAQLFISYVSTGSVSEV